MRAKAAVRATAALLVAGVFAPTIASAEARTAFLNWSTAPITVRAALGTETNIAFGPNEQITFASVDDAVRWDAHEAAPLVTDGNQIQRVAVTPSEASVTNMLVRTTERTYHLKLVAVQSAPSQVAFVYARTFISRAASAISPLARTIIDVTAKPPAAIVETPAPIPAPVVAQAVTTQAVPDVKMAATPAAASALIEGTAVAIAPPLINKDGLIATNPCPGAQHASNTIRTFQYVSQATDALVIVNALKAQSFKHVVFGPHTLPFYLGELALENYIVHQAIKKACPKTQNVVSAALGAAAFFNAATVPK